MLLPLQLRLILSGKELNSFSVKESRLKVSRVNQSKLTDNAGGAMSWKESKSFGLGTFLR